MTKEQFIALVNEDLKNERMHMGFYLQAGVMVQGLHRPELREFFLEEAQDELKHVEQFADLINYLGGVPCTGVNDYPCDLVCPVQILQFVLDMEQQVAENYSERLRQTEGHEEAWVSFCHVFYENQLEDSWRTAQEVRQLIKKYDHGGTKECSHSHGENSNS